MSHSADLIGVERKSFSANSGDFIFTDPGARNFDT
jgi:hypothetical protein